MNAWECLKFDLVFLYHLFKNKLKLVNISSTLVPTRQSSGNFLDHICTEIIKPIAQSFKFVSITFRRLVFYIFFNLEYCINRPTNKGKCNTFKWDLKTPAIYIVRRNHIEFDRQLASCSRTIMHLFDRVLREPNTSVDR